MGKQVRQLYDPVTGNFLTSNLGIQYPADVVDVEPIYLNNVLAGLRQVTQEEYDQHTEERRQRQQNSSLIRSGSVSELLSGIEWWTAEEYEIWLTQERIDLQSIIEEKHGTAATDGLLGRRIRLTKSSSSMRKPLMSPKVGAMFPNPSVIQEASWYRTSAK